MASTYVNDLRLNEMATGDQSGSWGTVTNTNLELIAEAFSFGTEGITTNADTHTTTIADGATDPGRSMFLKYTGTLDSACTITIAPNTVSKLWFIQNSTSGSQNIIISQGSGANVTIPAGQTKSVYSDGAGSGAAIVDAFATLNVVDLLVDDDLTVTDDVAIGGTALVTGVLTTTAATVFNGGFASNVASTIIAADGEADNAYVLTIKNQEATDDRSFGVLIQAGSTATDAPLRIATHDNGTTLFNLSGTGQAQFLDGTAALPAISNLGDLNTGILFPAADEVGISAGGTQRLNVSATGIDITGGFTATDGSTITTADNSDNLTLTSTDADASAGPNLNLYRNSDSPADSDFLGNIKFNGRNDNSQDVQYAEIEVYAMDVSDGAEDGLYNLNVMTSGTNTSYMQIRGELGQIVFNESSADVDFRIESTSGTYTFYMDAFASNTKITSKTTASDTSVAGGTSDTYINGLTIENNEASYTNGGLALVNKFSWGYGSSISWRNIFNTAGTGGTLGETNRIQSQYVSANNFKTVFYSMIDTLVTETLSVGASGTVVNDGGIDNDFRVESDGNTHALFVDAGSNVVCVGTNDISVAGNTGSARGINLNANGYIEAANYQDIVAYFNRLNNDGTIIAFMQNGVTEGTISVAGTTVSYNGGHLARWSQLADNTRDDTLLKGTVLTNLDQMAVWGDEDNEQLNCMAKSSVEGDANVAGVFVNWDNDDKTYTADMNIAMTGDMIIRIAQGTTVARGDLLMSAGDGTAKPQGDDIVRGKTIAKITSTHVTCTYDDGSYCVPCVLMAC